MFSESKRMSLLIQDLLSLSRIERTEYNPPTKKINITNIFNEVKDTFHGKKIKNKVILNHQRNFFFSRIL